MRVCKLVDVEGGLCMDGKLAHVVVVMEILPSCGVFYVHSTFPCRIS